MRGHRDLRLVMAAAVACALLSLLTPLGEVRAVFAVPLTLFLPGYAIAAAIVGRRALRQLTIVPLTLGASLTVLALGGILLNFLPGGIHGLSWALLLTLIVGFSCRTAARRRQPAPRRPAPVVRIPRPRSAVVVLAGGALAMTVAALVLAQTTVEADRAFGYSELWLAQQRDGVGRVGITSEQQQPLAYRLKIRLPERRIVREFSLEPGQTRVERFLLPPTREPVRVVAKLFKRDQPETVYRHVDGWLEGGGGLP